MLPRLSADGVIMLHDTVDGPSGIYDREKPYQRTVGAFVDDLRGNPDLEVFDLPVAQGLALVRRRGDPKAGALPR